MTSQRLIALMAHGSRDPAWKSEIETLCQLATQSSVWVKTTYMELCPPSLDDVIAEVGPDKISDIVIVPVFLATGKHLKVDIPAIADSLEQKYNIPITIEPAVGKDPEFAKALANVTSRWSEG